jgi:hypothetical protein
MTGQRKSAEEGKALTAASTTQSTWSAEEYSVAVAVNFAAAVSAEPETAAGAETWVDSGPVWPAAISNGAMKTRKKTTSTMRSWNLVGATNVPTTGTASNVAQTCWSKWAERR